MFHRANSSQISHGHAVLIIAITATIWGGGFPATRIALSGGMSVGVLMSMRFVIAGGLMAIIVHARNIPVRRQGVVDGIWLGVVLATLFWLQTDGMRFTTTAKSGFITGLYVLFTPLIAVAIGQRVKIHYAARRRHRDLRAVSAGASAGGWWAGWNRGDLETLGCAFLCAIHIVMMGELHAPLGRVAAGQLTGHHLLASSRSSSRRSAIALRVPDCAAAD